MNGEGIWIGRPERPALGWLDTPASGPGRRGVVLCPPIGYEYWSTHRTLRVLARRLADAGMTSLRLDYTGTGDAAGRPTDPGQVEAWAADLAAAVDRLRALGCSDVSLVGVRLGGLLALVHGGRVGATSTVTWDAVRSGRRHCRELTLLGQKIDVGDAAGGLSVGGAVLSAATLEAIADLDAHAVAEPPGTRVLLVDHAVVGRDPIRLKLGALRCEVDTAVVPSAADALEAPAEYATVSDDLVDTIVGWLTAAGSPGAPTPPSPAIPAMAPGTPPPPPGEAFSGPVASFRWGSGAVSEDVVTVGPDELVAVRTRPARNLPTRPATLVWLNTGSEHHVGPGRAWVEFTRDLALAGWTSLRVDFRGWGESPDAGPGPGRPYDLRTIDETQRLVAQLQARPSGPAGDPVPAGPVVVIGMCASAWVALAATATAASPPFAVAAMNPQLYWQPGDPVEANIETETHVRRLEEIARWQRIGRFGGWDLLDRLHVRHPAGEHLRRLERTGVPILWVFAEGDDGLGFLTDRVGRAWAGLRRRPGTSVAVLPGIDHSMRRTWERPRVTRALAGWLDGLEPVADPGGPVTIDLREGVTPAALPAVGAGSGAAEDPAGTRPLL